jgi:hypothetical protein
VKISLKPIFLGLSWWKFPLNQDFLGFPGENFRKPIHWKMVLTAFDYGHWTGLSQNVGEVSRILQVTIWFIFYKSVNNSHVYHHWVTFGSVSITLSFSDFSSTNYLRLWMAWMAPPFCDEYGESDQQGGMVNPCESICASESLRMPQKMSLIFHGDNDDKPSNFGWSEILPRMNQPFSFSVRGWHDCCKLQVAIRCPFDHDNSEKSVGFFGHP